MARLSAALLALAVTLAACGAAHAQGGCPITGADVAKLDFRKAAQSCKAGTPVAQLCEGCICALVEAFTPVIAAANVTQDQMAGVDQSTATQLLTACAGTVLGPLQRAGVSITTLFQLQQCQNAMPSCMAGVAAQLQANATQPLPMAQPKAP